MNTLLMSLAYRSSSVPRSCHGSCCSTARSVVHDCGHLKSGSIALTSNDCASTEPFLVAFGGAVGNRLGLAPGFEMTFPIHTNGTRPVNIPVPPRSSVCRSPTAFQLKPTRGENSGLALGSLL